MTRGYFSASRVALVAALTWAAVAGGAYRPLPLAILELLTIAGLAAWVVAMLASGTLEWRRSALDLPLALLGLVVLVQFALGNRPLVAWALAPPFPDPTAAAQLPPILLAVGTVSPGQTLESFLVFLTYAGVYVLTVNTVRQRRHLDYLVQILLLLGGVLAFFGLVDYLTADAWLIAWREAPLGGRLAGPFTNPDHFGVWLAMLTCLGLGYLTARRSHRRATPPLVDVLRSREAREEAVRRHLPFLSVALMALALVFTLSRGAVLALFVALGVLVALLALLGRVRRSLALVGALLLVTLGYASWIGLGPLLARAHPVDYSTRWTQLVTSVPILGRFPLLGVGLGAYKDVYFRYQPAALSAGRMYFPYAHNDVVQLALETGLLGSVIALFAVWRTAHDLVGAHLLARGRCPAGGGEDQWAERHDAYSVGLGLGGVTAAIALLAGSWFDFTARIPANGVLAATCLGIATVALHTRFGGESHLLVAVRRWTVSRATRRWLAAALALLAVAAAALVVRPLVDTHATPPALARRAQDDLDRAARIWNSGVTPTGQPFGSVEAQRAAALLPLGAAVAGLHQALARTPTDPLLHERLAWCAATAAVIDAPNARAHRATALTHLARAIALAPTNPFLHRSMVSLAATDPANLLPRGLAAARRATELDPDSLPAVVDALGALQLTAAQWAAAVPDTAGDRVQLAALLEQRGLAREALQLDEAALPVAAPGDDTALRYLLGRVRLAQGDARGALTDADAALARSASNPELHLLHADALAALGDPAALEEYRTALMLAATPVWQNGHLPFDVHDPRLASILKARIGAPTPSSTARYRRALATYLVARRLWQAALVEWNTLAAGDPGDAGAQFGRAVALEGLGEMPGALDAYRLAVKLDPANLAYRLRFAARLWDSEQFYQAINEWRAAVDLAPGNVEARLGLARAWVRVGERIEGFREYQRVLEVEPGQPDARRELARLGAR